jgi:hypothetical protein
MGCQLLFNEHQVIITKNNHTLLTGQCDPTTGLWCIPLTYQPATEPTTRNPQPPTCPVPSQCNHTYQTHRTPELIQYLHLQPLAPSHPTGLMPTKEVFSNRGQASPWQLYEHIYQPPKPAHPKDTWIKVEKAHDLPKQLKLQLNQHKNPTTKPCINSLPPLKPPVKYTPIKWEGSQLLPVGEDQYIIVLNEYNINVILTEALNIERPILNHAGLHQIVHLPPQLRLPTQNSLAQQ